MVRSTGGELARGFVGRRDAIAALGDELDAAAAGSSRIVWVEGEAGIGKTTLIRRFLGDVGPDHLVVWAAGAEEERLLRFGLLAQLAAGLSAGTGNREISPAAWDGDPLAVGATLLGALGDVDGASVVVIDDAHWADAESAGALLFALRRAQREAVLVVLGTRPDPAAALGESWGRLLRDESRVRRIGLEGLAAGELVDLAQLTVGSPLGHAGAERLHGHTRGHPMHARALLEELGTTPMETAQGVLPAPRSLASIVVAKVGSLPPAAQDLLSAMAVLGPSSSLAAAATIGAVEDPLSALEAAVGAELLDRPYGGDVRFAHPLVRGAIYNDLSPIRRRNLHLAAAAVTTGLPALDHRIAAAAPPDAVLAGELETHGLEELTDGRAALAEQHFHHAAALWAGTTDRDRCVLYSVEAAAEGGDMARVRTLRSVVEECGDTAQRSFMLGAVEAASGRFPEAEALWAESVADRSATALPDAARVRATAALASARLMLGRWEEALGPARAAIAGGAPPSGMARFALATCLSQTGRLDEASTVAAQASGDDPQSVAVSGLVRLWSDDLPGAVADLTAAVRPDPAGRTPRLLVVALSALSEAQYRLGRWDDAVLHGELAVSLGRDREQIPGWQQAHAVASYVHAGRGDFTLAEEHIEAAAGLLTLVPTWGGAAYANLARAVLAQARGDAAAMRRALAALQGEVRDNLERGVNWPWRVLLADGLLGADELDEAQRTVDGLQELIDRWQLTSPTTDAARLRGRLAEATGDLEAAQVAYDAGLAGPGRLPLPTARLQIANGHLLRRLGAKRAAIDQLRQARHRLATLGARPFLARCDEELAACGVVTRRGNVDPLGLTPSELAVAHLVAQGLSNRDVAARLYVSAKAVEYHLGHVYAKLGITSRRQLGGRLTGSPELAVPSGSGVD